MGGKRSQSFLSKVESHSSTANPPTATSQCWWGSAVPNSKTRSICSSSVHFWDETQKKIHQKKSVFEFLVGFNFFLQKFGKRLAVNYIKDLMVCIQNPNKCSYTRFSVLRLLTYHDMLDKIDFWAVCCL
ncbi:CLUMA_CG016835, isoform A [Clunio marinus]|uniref:CLUMA_CG016835, isoform A n=1 Tax=Clunio marinus TaxID=568069 RepID=A0A1J1IY81_9DIPT|nr:CLUMA_CG016835, isoform A [Clunio marinus]